MWYTKFGNMGDIILSSRVRLARNIKDIPFPHRANAKQQDEVIGILKDAGAKIKDTAFFDLSAMPRAEKIALAECHLISPNMLDDSIKRGLILSNDQRISLLINEEDHLRIQTMQEGFALGECLKKAMEIDDIIEEQVQYGFDESLGYLTCCPTNAGTGLRASVMACLPALKTTGRLEPLARSLSKMGIAVRGIFGEGSQSLGNIFQISNQVTLGISEEETVERLCEIITEIITQEREIERKIYDAEKFRTEDKVYRSYGILRYSKVLTSKEAMELISDVRLGINLGIIKETNLEVLNELMYAILPGAIRKAYNLEASLDRDVKRCEIIKEKLEKGG